MNRVARRAVEWLVALALVATARTAHADEPWLLDVNGSVPKLSSGDGSFQQSLMGDLLTGYQTGAWGVLGRGSFSTYNQLADGVLTKNFHTDGAVEAWRLVVDSQTLRVDVRTSFEGAQYKADTIPQGQVLEDKSLMYRGAALAGLRYTPDERTALGVWGGGGFQWEVFDDLYSAPGLPVRTEKTTAPSYHFELRARAAYAVVPAYLTVRLRVDASAFGISRNHVSVDVGGNVVVTSQSSRASQIEAHARLFFDLDALSFAGFVPAVHGGLDVISLSGASTTTVPSVGAGVRRDVF